MMEEEWERPIGLTKEYAICVDDSDDSIGDGGVGDGQPTKVNSKSDESMQQLQRNVCATSSSGSSYFQKRSTKSLADDKNGADLASGSILPKAQHEKKNDNGSATADAPSTDAQEDVVVGELAGPPTIANDKTI